MAVSLNVNGVIYNYPQLTDEGWGDDATNWAVAVTQGTLQKSGGLFALTADVDFGPSFGLKSIYYKTRSVNIAASGQFRLSNTDTIKFRNSGNTADLAFGPGSSDAVPQWNSIDLVNLSTAQTLTNKTIVGAIFTGGTFNSPTINTPTVSGGTFTTPSISSPSVSNGTFTGTTSFVNLTTSGNTILGDNSGDTITVTGSSTFSQPIIDTSTGINRFSGAMFVGTSVNHAIFTVGNDVITGAQGGNQYTGIASAVIGSAATTGIGSYVIAFQSLPQTPNLAITLDYRVGFYALNVPKGTGSTITRDIGLFSEVMNQGTNNAAIADNIIFNGNWFINSLNNNASLFSGPFELRQLATPSNPGAGFNRLYFKSDNNLYTLTSTGVETVVTPSVSAFVNGGNTFGGTATLGTNDNNNLVFKTNNITRLTLSNTSLTSTVQMLNASGNATNPGMSFAVDSNMGWYWSGGDLAWSIAGVQGGAIKSTSFQSQVPFYANNGSAGTPTYAYTNSSTTGQFLKAVGSVGFAANGIEIGSFSATGLWTIGAVGGTESHVINGNVTITGTTTLGTAGMIVDPLTSITLADNTTNGVAISNPVATSSNWIVDYSISRATTRETGTLILTTDGTTAQVTVQSANIGDPGVSFTADISGANVRLLYTTTSTGSTAAMRYSTRRWIF